MIHGRIETDILDGNRRPKTMERQAFAVHEGDFLHRLIRAALKEKARQVGRATTNGTRVVETRIVITV